LTVFLEGTQGKTFRADQAVLLKVFQVGPFSRAELVRFYAFFLDLFDDFPEGIIRPDEPGNEEGNVAAGRASYDGDKKAQGDNGQEEPFSELPELLTEESPEEGTQDSGHKVLHDPPSYGHLGFIQSCVRTAQKGKSGCGKKDNKKIDQPKTNAHK
jgi:hypothetical protein